MSVVSMFSSSSSVYLQVLLLPMKAINFYSAMGRQFCVCFATPPAASNVTNVTSGSREGKFSSAAHTAHIHSKNDAAHKEPQNVGNVICGRNRAVANPNTARNGGLDDL